MGYVLKIQFYFLHSSIPSLVGGFSLSASTFLLQKGVTGAREKREGSINYGWTAGNNICTSLKTDHTSVVAFCKVYEVIHFWKLHEKIHYPSKFDHSRVDHSGERSRRSWSSEMGTWKFFRFWKQEMKVSRSVCMFSTTEIRICKKIRSISLSSLFFSSKNTFFQKLTGRDYLHQKVQKKFQPKTVLKVAKKTNCGGQT